MLDWTQFLAALGVGFLGAGHCIGMCGGISSALSFALSATDKDQPPRALTSKLARVLAYNIGRIFSYCLAGLLLGLFSAQATEMGLAPVLRLTAGAMLVAMGLYLADWWRGLTYLEKAGGYLWRYIQPIGKKFMPVKSLPQALLLGAIWGWLPCGLIYSALVLAASTGSASGGALTMLAFGLGTLPALLFSGLAAERLQALLQKQALRQVFALCLIGFGFWTLQQAVSHSGHHDHHQGHHQEHHQGHHSGHHSNHIIDQPASNESASDESHQHHHHHH